MDYQFVNYKVYIIVNIIKFLNSTGIKYQAQINCNFLLI